MVTIWNKFWFRLVVILLASIYITEMGSIEPLSKRLLSAEFYKEYSATALISFVILEMIYRINRYLDNRLPWHGMVWHRLLLQVMFGLVVPVLLVLGLASFYFYLNGVNILRTDYLYYALPFVSVLIVFLNVLLIMTPYCIVGLQALRSSSMSGQSVSRSRDMLSGQIAPKESPVKVTDGTDTILLRQNEIVAAYIVGGKVLIRDTPGKELLCESNLDDLQKVLPPSDFFRINRQLILHRDLCKGFKPLEFGKVDVITDATLPVHTVVSQLKAKGFKEWVEQR